MEKLITKKHTEVIMSKETAVQLILDKFSLLSDGDFKSWILNHHDELIEMEREQIEDAFKQGQFNGNMYEERGFDIITSNKFYEQTYGGQDETI